MTLILTTISAVEKSKIIKDEIDRINTHILSLKENKNIDAVPLAKNLHSLGILCSDQALSFYAIKQGAVGAALFILKQENIDIQIECLTLLASLHNSSRSRDSLIKNGSTILLANLKSNFSISCLKAIKAIISKHENNKQSFFAGGICSIIFDHLEETQYLETICDILISLVSDDDRRPGIHPNTFVRARKIGENRKYSFVSWFILILKSLRAGDNLRKMLTILKTISCLLVNNTICDIALNNNMLSVLTQLFREESIEVKLAVCKVLKELSRNDNAKLDLMHKSNNILLELVKLVDQNVANAQICYVTIGLLNVVSLRQPEISQYLKANGIFLTVIKIMDVHCDHTKTQIEVMMLLRNMISSAITKHYVNELLDLGLEAIVLQARRDHPECEDAAYGLLRELGLQYT